MCYIKILLTLQDTFSEGVTFVDSHIERSLNTVGIVNIFLDYSHNLFFLLERKEKIKREGNISHTFMQISEGFTG